MSERVINTKVDLVKEPIKDYGSYTLYQVYAIREDGTKEPIYKEGNIE